MTRQMVDSVTVADLPAKPKMVGAYLDGHYANVAEARGKRPGAKVVTITVTGMLPADVCDQEKGDATPMGAARWAKQQKVNGHHPTIYCSVSQLPPVVAACKAVGLGKDDVSFWTAHYTGHSHLCNVSCWMHYGQLGFTPRIVATQYDDKGPRGEHFDRSQVADFWPGVDPEPKPVKHHIPPHVGAALFLLRRWLRRAHRKGWTLAPPAVERLTGCDGEIKAAIK